MFEIINVFLEFFFFLVFLEMFVNSVQIQTIYKNILQQIQTEDFNIKAYGIKDLVELTRLMHNQLYHTLGLVMYSLFVTL